MNIIERIRGMIRKREEAAGRPLGRITLRRVSNLEDADPPWWLRILSRPEGTIAERRPMPIIKCPNGHRFAVAGGHSVEGVSGNVDPRVGCPKCEWAAFVQLDGWEPA